MLGDVLGEGFITLEEGLGINTQSSDTESEVSTGTTLDGNSSASNTSITSSVGFSKIFRMLSLDRAASGSQCIEVDNVCRVLLREHLNLAFGECVSDIEHRESSNRAEEKGQEGYSSDFENHI